jgi:hypothetical protein
MVKRSYNPYINRINNREKVNEIFNPELHDKVIIEGIEYIMPKRSMEEENKINELLYNYSVKT